MEVFLSMPESQVQLRHNVTASLYQSKKYVTFLFGTTSIEQKNSCDAVHQFEKGGFYFLKWNGYRGK